MRRLASVAERINPQPSAHMLAYAHAVIAFGGQPESDEFAVAFAQWLETGGWRTR